MANKNSTKKSSAKKTTSAKTSALKKTMVDKTANQPTTEIKPASDSMNISSVMLEVRHQQQFGKTTPGKVSPTALERRLSGK